MYLDFLRPLREKKAVPGAVSDPFAFFLFFKSYPPFFFHRKIWVSLEIFALVKICQDFSNSYQHFKTLEVIMQK